MAIMLILCHSIFDYLSFKKHKICLVKDEQSPTTSKQENSDFIVLSDLNFWEIRIKIIMRHS